LTQPVRGDDNHFYNNCHTRESGEPHLYIMSVTVNISEGQNPQGWDRSVIFFANLLALFYGNEKETENLRRAVGSIESYGSRLIPLINLLNHSDQNMLLLEKEPQEELIRYFENALKLTIPKIEVVRHNLYTSIRDSKITDQSGFQNLVTKIEQNPSEFLDGYVTDTVLDILAYKTGKKTISTMVGSRRGNNKLFLHQYLVSKDLPVFDTFLAESVNDVPSCLSRLKDLGYTVCVIKAAIGASGIGMDKLYCDQKEKKIDGCIFYEGPCMVQGWLDGSVDGVQYIGSPSVQIFINDVSINLHDITEQILSKDSIHEGNEAPPLYINELDNVKDEILRQAELAGQWLHSQGYRGTSSTDFHLIRRGGKVEVRICEINARVTGATYPSVLARHFQPKNAWLMRNIIFKNPDKGEVLLNALKEERLLFHEGDNKGILPINFNPNKEGMISKGQFLFLGKTLDDARRLLNTMQKVSSIAGDYDRD